MILYPAIDIKDSQVVRLTLGDYDRMTVYNADPVRVAEDFRRGGATHLHVVDLDAARSGPQINLPLIRRIADVGLFTEVGGGARDADSVARYLDAGISRVIIGSAAVTQPGFVEEMAARFPGKIAVGVDARNGYVAIHGWRELTDVRAMAFLRQLPERGVHCAIYTDISRDGMLEGVNLAAMREAAAIANLDLIASGGVSSIADLRNLSSIPVSGAIVGKALYAGRLTLQEALKACEEVGS